MSMKLRLSSSLNTCRTTSVPVSWVLYQQVGLSVTPGPGLTAVLSVWTHSDSRKTSSARQVKVSASIVPATADQRGEAARPELPVVPRIHSAAERAERRQPGCSYWWWWWWWWRSGRRRSAGFSSAAAHVPVRRSRAAPSGAAAAARAHQTSTLCRDSPFPVLAPKTSSWSPRGGTSWSAAHRLTWESHCGRLTWTLTEG